MGLSRRFASLDTIDDHSIVGIHRKEEHYQRLANSTDYRASKLLADAWCVAFVWQKTKHAPEPVTENIFRLLASNPAKVPASTRAEIQRLTEQYQFFHWHLAFPDVFRVPGKGEMPENEVTGWSGGFDVVLGNPPWERIKLQEKEWFASRHPDIANAPNAAVRRRMIAGLKTDDAALYSAFLEDRRKAEGESHLVRDSGRYPLCGRGDVNTYAVFAETNRNLINPTGRVGCIVPSGIATDDTTKFFFQNLMDSRSLMSLYDFENREGIFPEVHRSYKFCLLTLTGSRRPAKSGAEFVFFAHRTDDLREDERRFTLSAEAIVLLSPNTRTCPIFRGRRESELTKEIYRRVSVLIKEEPPKKNPWGISFATMFHMANDSYLFRTREQLEADGWSLKGNRFHRNSEVYLPVYEGKMISFFDYRFASVQRRTTATFRQGQSEVTTTEQHQNPFFSVMPRYWIYEGEVDTALNRFNRKNWMISFMDVTSSTNHRTMVPCVLPTVAPIHKLPLINSDVRNPKLITCFLANLSSFAFDFIIRQKLGGISLSYFVLKQAPAIDSQVYEEESIGYPDTTFYEWLCPRIIELTYTAWELQPFAKDCGYDCPPFRWDEERRFRIRCELDAAYFHLYGIKRDDVDYIMETFPIVKRKDEEKYGEYRTKRVIL